MRAISRDLMVSEFIVRKVVKKDICYRSYLLSRGKYMGAAL